VMPRKIPAVFKQECELYGAKLVLEDGLINDCAKKAEALKAVGQYFDVSTMKEPYRLEGKKTMGYEIAEQYNWQLPGVIFTLLVAVPGLSVSGKPLKKCSRWGG
jgi:threonine synthase